MNIILYSPSSCKDFILTDVSTHAKRQLRKSIELVNINTEKKVQINANVDREIKFFAIKIYLSNNSSNFK
jgi:hypothetical protein